MAHHPDRMADDRGRELAAHAEAFDLHYIAELEMRYTSSCHLNVDAGRGVLHGEARPVGLSERDNGPQPDRVDAVVVSVYQAFDLGGRV